MKKLIFSFCLLAGALVAIYGFAATYLDGVKQPDNERTVVQDPTTNTLAEVLAAGNGAAANLALTNSDLIISSSGFNGIRSDTADASDNKSVFIGGGGAFATARGALLGLWGNEHPTQGGNASLACGDGIMFLRDGSGNVIVWTNGQPVFYFHKSVLPNASNTLSIGSQIRPFKEMHASNFNAVGSSYSINGEIVIEKDASGNTVVGGSGGTQIVARIEGTNIVGILGITGPEIVLLQGGTNNWNSAFGWGNHATAGYAGTSAVNAVSLRVTTLENSTNQYAKTNANISGFNNDAGFLAAESDPVWAAVSNQYAKTNANLSGFNNDAGFITEAGGTFEGATNYYNWATGHVWYVGLQGSIQAAHDLATSGDTLELAAGTYSVGELTITKSLHFKGQGPDKTIITSTAGSTKTFNLVNIDDVLLSGMTINANGSGSECIWVQATAGSVADNIIVQNCRLNAPNAGHAFYYNDGGGEFRDCVMTVAGASTTYGARVIQGATMEADAPLRFYNVIMNVDSSGGIARGIQLDDNSGSIAPSMYFYASSIRATGATFGRAIDQDGGDSVVYAESTIFNGSSHDYYENSSGSVTMRNCVLVHNTSIGTISVEGWNRTEGIQLKAGAAATNVQITITDNDDSLPTSGAVVDYVGGQGFLTSESDPVWGGVSNQYAKTNLFAGSGSTGLVTSTAGDTTKFLRGDGTWQTVSGGASTTAIAYAYAQGMQANYVDTNTVSITNGEMAVNGVMFAITNSVSHDISTVSGEEWHYIYVDYDASTAPNDVVIVSSTTEPAFKEVTPRHGWYNGDDRCIAAVYSHAGTNAITPFVSTEKNAYYWNQANILALASGMNPNSTWQTPNNFESSLKTPVTAKMISGLLTGADSGSTGFSFAASKELADTLTTAAGQYYHGGTKGFVGSVQWQINVEVELKQSRNIRLIGADNDDNSLQFLMNGYGISR